MTDAVIVEAVRSHSGKGKPGGQLHDLHPTDLLAQVRAGHDPLAEKQKARQAVTVAALAIGNPHAVLRVADVDSAPVATLGPLIESPPES